MARVMSEFDGMSREELHVTVIIPVLNDGHRLVTCLQALAVQTWPTSRLEVLVVDNGSSDDIEPLLEAFSFVRLLREPQPGSYAARNRALGEVQSTLVAFTDSDCIPQPRWLEAGVDALVQRGPNAIVGGDVALFAADSASPTLAEDFELAVGFSQRTYVEQRHFSVTANLFTTLEVLSRVGPFNAALRSGGDKEWGQRAHRAGVPLFYAEGAVVRHPARRTMSTLFAKRARLVGGHLGMAQTKHSRWVAFSLCMTKACLPPVNRVLSARRRKSTSVPPAIGQGGKGWRRYARVFAVGLSLQAYSVVELCRLQCGGVAKR